MNNTNHIVYMVFYTWSRDGYLHDSFQSVEKARKLARDPHEEHFTAHDRPGIIVKIERNNNYDTFEFSERTTLFENTGNWTDEQILDCLKWYFG